MEKGVVRVTSRNLPGAGATTAVVVRSNREQPRGRRAGAQWHPKRGWAVPTPATTRRAYVSGDAALNLRKLAEDADRRDWHEWGTWWSPTPTEPDGTALKIERWGPDGENAGAPGSPELRDARVAMTAIAHPSTENAEPIYAATVLQAVLDLAWDALTHGRERPDRRATWQ